MVENIGYRKNLKYRIIGKKYAKYRNIGKKKLKYRDIGKKKVKYRNIGNRFPPPYKQFRFHFLAGQRRQFLVYYFVVAFRRIF